LQSLLIGCMTPLSVPAGTAVVTQGDRGGDTFYVLRAGACDVLVDGKRVTELAPGRAFGELALLYACPRAATVMSTEPSQLWVLQQRWFRLVARSAAQLRLQQKARAPARSPCPAPVPLRARRHRHPLVPLPRPFALRSLADLLPAPPSSPAPSLPASQAALLCKVRLFRNLSPEQLSKVAESLASVEYPPGAPIIIKGEVGDCFYLLRAGEVVVSDGGRVLARLSPGAAFGDRALLTDEVRAAHISAAPECAASVFALSREAFKGALAMVEETFRLDALGTLAELAPLSASQLVAVAGALEREVVPPGAEVARAGAPMDGLLIVEEGALEVSETAAGWAPPAAARPASAAGPGAAPGAKVLLLCRGAALGGAGLLSSSRPGADGAAAGGAPATLRATAAGGAAVLRLRRAAFVALFGTLEEVTSAARLAALRRVPLLAALSPEVLLSLSRELEPLAFPDGAAVVTQGERGDAFYLLERGAAAVTDAAGTEYARLREGAYFGELALLADAEGGDAASGVRKASVVARGGPLHVLRMTRAAFVALRAAHPAVAAGLAAGEAGYTPVAFVARIGLADLSLRRALGVGTFGKVFLAHHAGKRYALKQVAKAHVVAKGLVAHIKRERDVMEECVSPFLVNLAASFQDAQSLYMMMELVMGGELFYYLQSLSAPLPEASARFYTGCVVEAFDFLHARHYVYRDLKPENLLLTATGYLKVADFSFVKRLRAGKTYTLCGTPAYLAPEQITRAGHDRAVDWWALGVLTYEMLAGISPFYHDDDMTMFKRIVDVKCAARPVAAEAGTACTAC
jgi:cGMP-dependent protein kinase